MSHSYDLALYPAAGPGLGHLMRCMALAEAAVDLKARAVVVLGEVTAVAIEWPAPVLISNENAHPAADLAILDGPRDPRPYPTPNSEVWRIVDERPAGVDDVTGFIYPHYGAAPVHEYPTFVGPEWMPLRREFVAMTAAMTAVAAQRSKHLCSYKCANPPQGTRKLEGLGAREVAGALRMCRGLMCPPGTIAYEGLACGAPVMLLHTDISACEAVGTAMVAAGVASWSDTLILPARSAQSHIDGRGAIRLLEALL